MAFLPGLDFFFSLVGVYMITSDLNYFDLLYWLISSRTRFIFGVTVVGFENVVANFVWFAFRVAFPAQIFHRAGRQAYNL